MAVESHDKKLDDLLKMVEDGKAQLPDFQRSSVWVDTKIDILSYNSKEERRQFQIKGLAKAIV